jgi:hypothetical protein
VSSDWTEHLTTMIGKDALIMCAAKHDHDAKRDPAIALLAPDRASNATWLELMDAGFEQLEKLSHEISDATSSADAATAQIRKQTVLDGLKAAEDAVLRMAHSMLVSDTCDIAAIGRVGATEKKEIVPAIDWEVGNPDWEKSRLAVEGKPTWNSIRYIDLTAVDEDTLHRIEAALRPGRVRTTGIEQSIASAGGRPVETDWQGADKAAQGYIHEYGLPKIKSRLVDFIAEWLTKNDAGKPPARRTIEKHVASTFYGQTS